jgi:hypothetical protein
MIHEYGPSLNESVEADPAVGGNRKVRVLSSSVRIRTMRKSTGGRWTPVTYHGHPGHRRLSRSSMTTSPAKTGYFNPPAAASVPVRFHSHAHVIAVVAKLAVGSLP